MAYQSLYRRYRSGRFSELVGQEHVVTALRNAVSEGRVGHAYLFSGPRGTGKTSTARILGKALNCTALGDDGEPCCECESCLSFAAGTSYDLQELDAASNNGVEAIRDLISKVALGSPGRTKVYILDEVHMLTAGAENALLKTLEEPPDHVVFVLATTEPHKVVPTIRSRTQHYEFQLIPADKLEAHVRWVAEDAGLAVTDEMIDYVLRAGGGSARDALSALDQAVAAGGVPHDEDAIAGILEGLADHDAAAVVSNVSAAMKAGRDPRVIGEALLSRLRDAFLASMSAPVDHLSDTQAAAAAALAGSMGPAAMTRALETIGTSLVEMRQAPDPRVDLEVALLRLSRPDIDTDIAALTERIERLERGLRTPQASGNPSGEQAGPAATHVGGSAARPADGARAALAGAPRQAEPPQPAEPSKSAQSSQPAEPSKSAEGSQPAEPRRSAPTLGARRGTAQASSVDPGESPVERDGPSAEARPKPPAEAAESVARDSTEGSSAASLEVVEAAWPDVKAMLSGRAKSRFSGGRFLDAGPDGIVFGLPNSIHRDRCADCAPEVEKAISDRLGVSVRLELVVDGEAPQPKARGGDHPEHASAAAAPQSAAGDGDDEEEVVDLSDLTDAPVDEADGLGLFREAFPGVEVVDGSQQSS